MNEAKQRIKELAEQVGAGTPQSLYGRTDYIVMTESELENFAELIIQKCMACSTWVGKNNTNTVEPMHTAQAINQRIKQQFGVAEREE